MKSKDYWRVVIAAIGIAIVWVPFIPADWKALIITGILVAEMIL